LPGITDCADFADVRSPDDRAAEPREIGMGRVAIGMNLLQCLGSFRRGPAHSDHGHAATLRFDLR